MTRHRLDLGDLDLANADSRRVGYWFELEKNEGFTPGSPEPVKAILASLMRDGANSQVTRYENREVAVRVRACGADSLALAAAERALTLACAGRTTLSWTPPDGLGEPIVWDVLNAVITAEFSEIDEFFREVPQRVYRLTLECKPFARTASPVTQTFTPAAATITTVDDASSAALWSDGGGEYPITPTAATYLGESVIEAAFTTTGEDQRAYSKLRWKPASAAGMPTTPYLTLDVAWGASLTKYVTLNDFTTYPVASETVTLGSAAYTRYYFVNPHRASGGTPASSSSALVFNFRQRVQTASTVTNRVAGLSSSTTAGATSVVTLDARGSVRSPASITYGGSGSARSRFLLYADPVLLEGFDPANQASWALGPDGTYVVYCAALGTSAVGDILTVTVTDTAGRSQTLTTRLTAAIRNRGLWPLGQAQLGGFDTGTIGNLTLSMRRNGSTVTPTGYRLFRKHPDAALTYLDTYTNSAGAATAISTLDFRVDAPTLGRPSGGVYVAGVSAFRHADPWDFPMVVPPVTAIYTEDSSTVDVRKPMTATYFPRGNFAGTT